MPHWNGRDLSHPKARAMPPHRPSRRAPHHAQTLLSPFLAAMLLALGCASTRDPRSAYLQLIRPDQKPSLVGARAATDSLYGDPRESQRGDGIAESRRDSLQELVQRFAPTLVLPKGDHIQAGGRRFQLLPCDPMLLADTLRIDQIDAAPYLLRKSQNVPLRSVSPDSLMRLTEEALGYLSDPDHLEIWYFDVPGETPREWWKEYARLRTGPDSSLWAKPTVWAHPFMDGAGRVILQYWFCYPFNDYTSNHEGDWEHLNVVLNDRHDSILGIDYYFHGRSVRLPQGDYLPEIEDGTHPVIYVGGRAYMVFDYPNRLFSGDKNSGSHGNYPYPGEWEAAAALGHTESVSGLDDDTTRVVGHDEFRVVLVPEPSRVEYQSHPELLRDWAPLLLPVRWGFPSGPSMASSFKLTDVGNRAPFGPAYNAGWNRTAPGLAYPGYRLRKIPTARSYAEDLLQPWYYLYIFRHPRFVNETRGALDRKELERLGFAPRSGWNERGVGSALLGMSVGFPQGDFGDLYRNSVGFLLWRNFWLKARFGAIELEGGYQKFDTVQEDAGSIFSYPFTASIVLRGPEGTLRPYVTVGGGASGWESRLRIPNSEAKVITSGWGWAGTASVGVEYYLRPKVAFDLALRFIDNAGPGSQAGLDDDRLRFLGLWAGHYIRF
jgi:hypothetical protein